LIRVRARVLSSIGSFGWDYMLGVGRTKLNEQSILNRRIQTLTAEKRAAETERNDVREKAQEKEKELEDKLETKEKELEDWKARAEKAEEATGATAKRALAMQFIVAELVRQPRRIRLLFCIVWCKIESVL